MENHTSLFVCAAVVWISILSALLQTVSGKESAQSVRRDIRHDILQILNMLCSLAFSRRKLLQVAFLSFASNHVPPKTPLTTQGYATPWRILQTFFVLLANRQGEVRYFWSCSCSHSQGAQALAIRHGGVFGGFHASHFQQGCQKNTWIVRTPLAT